MKNRGRAKKQLKKTCRRKKREYKRKKIRQEKLVTLTCFPGDALFWSRIQSVFLQLFSADTEAVDGTAAVADTGAVSDTDTDLLAKRARPEWQHAHHACGKHGDGLNLIAEAPRRRMMDQPGAFAEVIGMIDALIENLRTEQRAERSKRNTRVRY